MDGENVSLDMMLECRERRARIQAEFIKIYGCPVISFSMNIPGPVKTNIAIKKAFEIGKNILLERLKNLKINEIKINDIREFHDITGDELILSAAASAEILKNITVQIEEDENIKAARLFDMDVIDVNYQKLSRPAFRKCLICERPAQVCARSRAHSVDEMQTAIERLLI